MRTNVEAVSYLPDKSLDELLLSRFRFFSVFSDFPMLDSGPARRLSHERKHVERCFAQSAHLQPSFTLPAAHWKLLTVTFHALLAAHWKLLTVICMHLFVPSSRDTEIQRREISFAGHLQP